MRNEPTGATRRLLCSLVVPAYNEGAVIEQRLGPLLSAFHDGELEVAVVANGCSDDTAAAARRLPGVKVGELTEASKSAALNAGDGLVTAFPRIYLDADVRISAESLRRLAAALATDRAVVGAPRVTFDVSESSWVVRSFHEVFAQLPYASEGLVGLGVYGLSEAGRRRFGAFPDVVADDLYIQNLFRPDERIVVDDTFAVVTPRNSTGLLAVRTRVARGNREIARRAQELRPVASDERHTVRALLLLVARRPRLLPAALVYVGVNLVARGRAVRAGAGAAWERDESSRRAAPQTGGRIMLDGVPIDSVTEADVVGRVMRALADGTGGRIVTPNVNIHQELRRPAHAGLIEGVELLVADGMPLVWASRFQGQPLPERVAGSSLVWSLAGAAAAEGRSVFLLGAEPDVAASARARLAAEFPGLAVAGSFSPPLGFESSAQEQQRLTEALTAASPDIVFVGLGFPKQERLMAHLHALLPGTWFIGCGGSIDFIAGRLPRAPEVVQRLGLEWMFRLAREPRRLFKRYVVHGIPHAVGMLARSAATGVRTRGRR